MKDLPNFYIDIYREKNKGDGKPEEVNIETIKKDFYKRLKEMDKEYKNLI